MTWTERAPDAVGPLIGYRVWHLDARRTVQVWRHAWRTNPRFGELQPLNARRLPEGWPGWQRLEAECKAEEPHELDDVPGVDCRCGIYAVKEVGEAEEPLLFLLAEAFWHYAKLRPFARRETWIAAGTVALWGRVIEGTRGYRAEYGYPAALWVLPPAVFGGDDAPGAAEVMPDLIPALRSRYGVPVGYAGNSPEWSALIVRPSVGPFFSWRFRRSGGEALAETLGHLGLPSGELPTVADALGLHFAGLRYGERQEERRIATTYLEPAFGELPLRRLGRRQLASYRARPPRNPATGRPYSERTVRRHLAVLRAAVSDAADRGWFVKPD